STQPGHRTPNYMWGTRSRIGWTQPSGPLLHSANNLNRRKCSMPLKFKLALCSCIGIFVFAASETAPAQQDRSAGKRTLIRAGHILDVKTGKLSDAQTI